MKNKLWLYVLVIVLGLGSVQIYKVINRSSQKAATHQALSPMKVSSEVFSVQYGIDRPSPEVLKQWVKDGTPLLIEFKSQLCTDCQKMAPALSRLIPKFPAVSSQVLDVLEDRKKAPEIFRAFNPATVPVLVFINRKGEIETILNGYQSETTLFQAFTQLASPAS